MERGKILQFLVPILLFVGVFSAIVATIDDYGLVWDEKFAIETAIPIEQWFANAGKSPSSFDYDTLNSSWYRARRADFTGDAHPPFIKLSAIAFRYLAGNLMFDNIVFQYRVSTAFWASILVVMLFLVVRRFTGSALWGLLGGLTFITIPRFFAEAHFFATDMIVSALGFSGLAVFMFASRPWVRVLFGGLIFGAALATKFTGILAIAIVAPMIIIAEDRKRFIREYLWMLPVSLFFFSLFNFPLLINPAKEIAIYFTNFFDREKMLPISTLYFGEVYDFRLPFHEPWVMFGITLSEMVVITAGIGIIGGIIRFARSRDPFSYFSLVPFLMLMGVYMLPTTPKHDGIRLFSSVWPFIVLLSISGCYWVQSLFGQKFRVGMVVCIVSLLLSSGELSASHPYELSYYNRFIGGSKGAQEKGFIVSYWYEAFNREFLQNVSRVTGNRNVGIFSYPDAEMLLWNQRYGLFPPGLRSVPREDEYQYLLVLNRILTPEMQNYLEGCELLLKLETRDGAFIGGLYQNR